MGLKKISTIQKNRSKWDELSLIFYIILYFIVNLLTLTSYPFVHSDEPWLAALSLEYLQKKSIFVTESFFDLMPRQPHAIKSLFHGLQSLFISLFGYSIHSVRLVSLLAGIFILFVLYKYAKSLYPRGFFSVLLTALFSLNIQFIYASHFARQEILLLLVLCLSYTLYSSKTEAFLKKSIIIPCIIGLSIGFHPNAFIIAVMMGLIYCKDLWRGFIELKTFLSFAGILSLFAVIYIGISLIGNPNFFTDYWGYGTTLSVNAGLGDRWMNFLHFYSKIYQQIAGTYYLPDLKFFFITALFIVFSSLFFVCKSTLKKESLQNNTEILNGYLLLIGFNIAIFMIGRYNPTSILFFIYPIYIIGFTLLRRVPISANIKLGIVFLLCLISAAQFHTEYEPFEHDDYTHYIHEIQQNLPKNPVVLGNLSSGFAFEGIEFYDIRNLGYLHNSSVEEYLLMHHINTIIYYEEYDYIHRNQQWEILYGDDKTYYDELNKIIASHGKLLHQFEDTVYGNRIVPYIHDYPWQVKIYRLSFE